MTTDEGKRQQQLHRKGFFGSCYKAINNGSYLEAMLLEFAALENRVAVIFRELDMPCSTCKDTDIIYNIGLYTKLVCLRKIIQNNEHPAITGNTKLSAKLIREIIDWTRRRNKIIHRLYTNPDVYDEMIIKSEGYAKLGMEYASIMYAEANRLKNLKRRHPELFKDFSFLCPMMANGNLNDACLKAKQWRPKDNEKSTQ